MHRLITLWFGWVHDWGYLGIVVLMAMESTIFPVPSELVIPPAAYWAVQGRFTLWGVVLAGTVGSALGAWLAGRIFDATGSYAIPFALAAAAAVIAAVAMWVARTVRLPGGTLA